MTDRQYLEKLKKMIKRNESSIHKNEALIHELNIVSPDNRLGRIALMGVMCYLPVFPILYFLNVHGIIFPFATVLTSLGASLIINAIVEKKYNCKKRFKKVSKSKNESERIEEIFRLELENEKLKNRNDVINNVIERIEKENELISSVSSNKRYSISKKNQPTNKDKLVWRINLLEDELKKKFEYLDILTEEEFMRNKSKSTHDKLDIFFHSMIASAACLSLYVPTIFAYTARPLASPSLIPLFGILGSGVATFAGGIGFLSKKKRDEQKAVNTINKERDEITALNLDYHINNTKSAINNGLFALKDYKKDLEALNNQKVTLTEPNKIITEEYSYDYTLDDGPKLRLK